jgi:Ca-activated chloride channel homolog
VLRAEGAKSASGVVDALLATYFDELRRPSRTIYVLDTSGSLEVDERIGALRRSLAGADPSLTAQFRRFRGREEVTLLPFATVPAGAALRPGGDTAIYESLERPTGSRRGRQPLTRTVPRPSC